MFYAGGPIKKVSFESLFTSSLHTLRFRTFLPLNNLCAQLYISFSISADVLSRYTV